MVNNYAEKVSCTTEMPESTIQIGIASTPKEKREIYRFRYKIYVEEMSRPIKEIDHANKLLYDDMDDWGLLLYAKIGGKLIATARINIGKYGDFSKDAVEFLSLDTFKNGNGEQGEPPFAFVSKLMVEPSYRSSPTLYMLLAKCYELSCRRQVTFIFGFCNLHLIRMYEKLGMHRYYKNFDPPGYGLQVPIILLTNDIQHLRAVRSPIFRIARQLERVDSQSIEWFHETFTEHSTIINSQMVTEEELWSILSQRLHGLPTEAIIILQELSATEAKKFLHSCGSLVPCEPGNKLALQNDISYSYNILVSGKLKSLTFIRQVKEYSVPGQYFGANGLTEHNKHTEDIVAVEPSEILVLSGIAFQRFYHSYPDIAHKVTQRINNLTRKK